MYLQKVISKKTFFLNKFFVGILKVNDENRRFSDPHQHPDPDPLVKRHGSDPRSGSTPKCHGSATLPVTFFNVSPSR
jgi:hypothetical protein